jgi:hypothetical protein
MRKYPSKGSAVLVLALALAGGFAAAADSGRKLYKWVDEKGVVHYGDSIPPKYAKQERRVLNEHGVEVGKLDAEKTDAERKADDARLRVVTDAKQRDKILLTTYVSVKQIEQLRDQRLDLIESQIQVSDMYVANLQTRLNQLHARAQFFRPYSSNSNAKSMPDQVAEDLVRTVNEIRVQRTNLAGKRSEQDTLRKEFQADIERYKELKNLR